MRPLHSKLAWAFWATLMILGSPTWAGLIININYTGDAQYQSYFTNAKAYWEGKLSGYQNGVVVSRTSGSSWGIGQSMTGLTINASVTSIDGAGGILGQAGPTEAIRDQLNFRLATDGIMQFDSADIVGLVNGGLFDAVILHEMAHVMGFGTLWTDNGVYTNGSGEFTGAFATAAWQSEFGQSGTPNVELGGGAGTANGHWNEVDGGAGATGITNAQGRDMRDELMTGWLNSNPFVSNMTIQSFRDIGFTITAVPEPTSLSLAGFSAVAFLGSRVWRKRRPQPSAD